MGAYLLQVGATAAPGEVSLTRGQTLVPDPTSGVKFDTSDWSEAKKKAYQQLKKSPNTYYYRFCAPGVKQKNGSWTKEEEKLFMARLEEMGGPQRKMQWGIFSMSIPGRVGYQCSNFYRQNKIKAADACSEMGGDHRSYLDVRLLSVRACVWFRLLIKQNKIKAADACYEVGDDGKLHHINGKGQIIKHHKKHTRGGAKDGSGAEDGADTPTPEGAAPAKPKRQRRKKDESEGGHRKRSRKEGEGEGDGESSEESSERSDDGAFVPSCNCSALSAEVLAARQSENPLPGFLDAVTQAPVERPALSPYGHVLGYDTWVRILTGGFGDDTSHRNRCPFTRQPLNKRELVILTKDNIDQYRDRIKMAELPPASPPPSREVPAVAIVSKGRREGIAMGGPILPLVGRLAAACDTSVWEIEWYRCRSHLSTPQ
ncbi:putative myb family protein [Paratrimastix pyriformis]|uniref:Myb family protein n=1 Tax=Paratrimastix pyriformis TaxID=342808 RepID=A0ABQ8UIJ7_9EUKA|nr:putative myb family protein [Paratrimastix pyriformis]